MRVDQFDFDLPPDCIADRPVSPRDSARLLRVTETAIHDLHVADLPDILRAGDVLVFNDTRVIPARLYGTRGSRKVEVLLYQEVKPCQWLAMARPAKRLKSGDQIEFADGFRAEVLGRTEDGSVQLQFDGTEAAFSKALADHGHMPLPPYIGRADDERDRDDYQTIYAQRDGAVAAPTAGLHFTETLVERLKSAGVQTAYVTLHVGLGTFQPVKVDDTDDHVMHFEYGEISPQTAEQLNAARRNGQRIVAVGTTSLRVLESASQKDGSVQPFAEKTDLFIVPGYRFRIVDMLMTNFHLPRSTLVMLISAFAGEDRIKHAYEHATGNGYRFYSYGDACLLERRSVA